MNIRLPIASVSALFLMSSLSPALAESNQVNARCLLRINGKTYMDDRCQFKRGKDSDYFSDLRIQITCPNGRDASESYCSGVEERVTKPGVFGLLVREKDVASLCWNVGKFRTATPCFQGLRRSGACWANPRAKDTYNTPPETHSVKFCAWAL